MALEPCISRNDQNQVEGVTFKKDHMDNCQEFENLGAWTRELK